MSFLLHEKYKVWKLDSKRYLRLGNSPLQPRSSKVRIMNVCVYCHQISRAWASQALLLSRPDKPLPAYLPQLLPFSIWCVTVMIPLNVLFPLTFFTFRLLPQRAHVSIPESFSTSSRQLFLVCLLARTRPRFSHAPQDRLRRHLQCEHFEQRRPGPKLPRLPDHPLTLHVFVDPPILGLEK